MRRVTDLSEDIYDNRNLEHERELLLALWELSDHRKICFISIDLEGPTGAITELGLAFQRKNDSRREGRHIIVKSTQHLKRNPPRTCGYGLASEEVDKSEELYTILDDFFEHQRCENSRVVLTGFDIKNDLSKLDQYCGWRPPIFATLMDAASIFRTLSGKKSHPKQADALAVLGFAQDPTAPSHNAANDAWYALELLFRKAEQALWQLEEFTGKDTIDWLVPTKTPPSSPVLNDIAATLSIPFDIDSPVHAPGLPPRLVFTVGTPALPPSHKRPQSTQTPTSSVETPGASGPSRKRKRRRRSQRDGPGDTADTIDATPSATPVDSRPMKRQKMMVESPKNGPAVERVSAPPPKNTLLDEAKDNTRSSQGQCRKT